MAIVKPNDTLEEARCLFMGQEKREIKALSSEDIEGYLKGYGMGLARAAELNHYPGPKHVLELAGELGLTEEQSQRTKEIYKKMHTEAISLGRQIIQKEKRLDLLFKNQEINQKSLKEITLELGKLQGRLRAVHLKAHLETNEILSLKQIGKYDVYVYVDGF